MRTKIAHDDRQANGRVPNSVRAAAAWAISLALAAAWLAAHGRPTRDPDSLLYARIAADLSGRPVHRWIAPEWPPGSYMQGYFREHPAGLFVPAAVLARLGYPAGQSAFAANLLYQALTLVLVARLAASLVAEPEARALAWILQLLPLAFAYRVRANHEQPLVMCLAAALLGLEHARRDARWSLLTVAGLLGILLVKGLLAAPAFLVCLVWVVLRRSGGRAWLALTMSAAAAIATVASYEASYREVTGESFLASYLGRQVLTGHVRDPLARLGGYAYAFVWYAARVLWFAFPWSLVALGELPRLAAGRGPRASGGWIALVTTALYLLLFSASERRAERYVFPACYAVAVAGALAAPRRFPRFARLVARTDRLDPWAAPALFFLLFALHLAGGWLHLPRIKIWGPDVGP